MPPIAPRLTSHPPRLQHGPGGMPWTFRRWTRPSVPLQKLWNAGESEGRSRPCGRQPELSSLFMVLRAHLGDEVFFCRVCVSSHALEIVSVNGFSR